MQHNAMQHAYLIMSAEPLISHTAAVFYDVRCVWLVILGSVVSGSQLPGISETRPGLHAESLRPVTRGFTSTQQMLVQP